jgi:predicted amidohydrolase YtcJ
MLVVGDIITMDPAHPRADAMATSGGAIVAVGTPADAAAALPPGTVVHHAPGTVVPGLIDSHLHLQWAGLLLLRLLGEEPVAPDQALATLDAATLTEPWPDGEPTRAQRLAALRVIQPFVHALGITGVVDPALTPVELGAYVECQRRGELKTRVVAMPHPDLESGAEAAIAALEALGVGTGLGDDWLQLGGLKVYFDGVGMSGTALRREPWPGRERQADGHGWQRVSDSDFYAIAAYCARSRWSLGVHVVGGGGIDRVLETFAQINADIPIADLGFTLIHAYLEPSEANLGQTAALGVLVAAQPAIHWTNGVGLVQRLGNGVERANPIASWLDAGVTVGGGSDGPYFPLDPRLGLWQARTRQVAGTEVPHAPELGLDPTAALALYTTGAAAVSLAGSRRGQLQPGFLADWVALGVDPLSTSTEALRTMPVLETAIGGAIVYRSAA